MLKVFISHATEDKDSIARPLAELLIRNGISVWYDEYELKLGDSLRKSIDKGLTQSDFGIVILSPSFFKKNWTEYELNSLVTLELAYSRKIILPVWHNVELNDVIGYSPSLADKIAANTKHGFDSVARQVLDVLNIKQTNISNHYDINSDANIRLNWGAFNSERLFENIQLLIEDNMPVWQIRSTKMEDTGINLFNLPSKGTINFEYKVLEMNIKHPNVVFYMIPIKIGGKLVEVGFDKYYDERNSISIFRDRKRPRLKIGEWINEQIPYDYEDLTELEYVIFGPRINEGCAFRGNGLVQIRNVVVR